MLSKNTLKKSTIIVLNFLFELISMIYTYFRGFKTSDYWKSPKKNKILVPITFSCCNNNHPLQKTHDCERVSECVCEYIKQFCLFKNSFCTTTIASNWLPIEWSVSLRLSVHVCVGVCKGEYS